MTEYKEWPKQNPEWDWSEVPKGTEEWWSLLPAHLRFPDPDIYRSDNYTVLDFETTNEDFGNAVNPDNKLILSGWLRPNGDKPTGRYKFGGEYNQELLVTDIESSDFIVAHNAKFELGWLKRCGWDIASKPVWCTQIAEYVIAGNRQKYQLSLDACCARRGYGQKSPLIKRLWGLGVSTGDIPRGFLLPYLKNDVYECWRVFLHQLRYILLYAPELLEVVFTRCLFTPVLADVEFNGVAVAEDRVRALHSRLQRRHAELEREFVIRYGECNWKSPVDKDRLLYKELGFSIPKVGKTLLETTRVDKEDPSRKLGQTNEEALNALKAVTPEQKAFLKLFRELQKSGSQLTKYLNKFKIVCEKYGGHLHAQFNQTVTKTHRLSSSGLKPDTKIQFQNFDSKFKPLITAREGYLVGEADFHALEWVTAVQLTQDIHGLNTILAGEDRHAFTATKIFKTKFTEATGDARKKLRTAAKAHTFKPLFGGETGTRAERDYYEAFREEFKTLSDGQHKWASSVLRDGFLRLPLGLKAYWPGTKLTQNGITNKTKIYNYPIQSTATADVVPIASVYVWHAMRVLELESFLTNFVHDSVISELKEEEIDVWTEICETCFTSVVYWYLLWVFNYSWVVPLKAEVEVKTHWTDTPEWRKEWL
jgi:DNA polymerase I-like protein with 3'-5' exonuclease and polymerase domains